LCRRALAMVAAEIRPVMHGPVLLVLIFGLGVAGVVLARLLLIPLARQLQARRGYSDQFVSDLALAVPLGAFGFVVLAGLIWLAR
jgi:hypothetical protein